MSFNPPTKETMTLDEVCEFLGLPVEPGKKMKSRTKARAWAECHKITSYVTRTFDKESVLAAAPLDQKITDYLQQQMF